MDLEMSGLLVTLTYVGVTRSLFCLQIGGGYAVIRQSSLRHEITSWQPSKQEGVSQRQSKPCLAALFMHQSSWPATLIYGSTRRGRSDFAGVGRCA
jgi:hypothetical protein